MDDCKEINDLLPLFFILFDSAQGLFTFTSCINIWIFYFEMFMVFFSFPWYIINNNEPNPKTNKIQESPGGPTKIKQ